MTNTIIGAGVLSLPSAFEISGLYLGLFFLLFVFMLNVISVWFLVGATEISGGAGVQFRDVAEYAFGKVGLFFTDIALIISCFGPLCSYLIIICDMITSLIAYWGNTEIGVIDRDIVLCVTAVLVMPLSCLRYINLLRFTSLAALVAVFYIMVAIIYRSGESILEHGWKCNDHGCMSYANFDLDFFRAVPIICFAFTCQMNVFSIFSELKNPTRGRMLGTGVGSLAVSGFVYLLIAVFGYLTFFGETQGNILLNYAIDDPLFIVARIALSLILFLSYPLMAHPLVNSLDGLFFSKRPFSWIRRIAFAVATCLVSLVVALFVKDVAIIFGITGSTGSTILAFLLPALFILYLDPGKITTPKKLLAIALFGFGIIFVVISTTVIILDEVINRGNGTEPGNNTTII